MTTPADEISAAADKLRPSSPAVATHTVAVRLHPDVTNALAKLLREIAALHEPTTCQKHESCGPLGCDWCGDEDWPCNDIRNALAVARAINTGGRP